MIKACAPAAIMQYNEHWRLLA